MSRFFREVKASERLPEEGDYYNTSFQEEDPKLFDVTGYWPDEPELWDNIKVWLEPIDITEEEIVKIFESRARAGGGETDGNVYYSDLPVMYFKEVASMILSKLKNG